MNSAAVKEKTNCNPQSSIRKQVRLPVSVAFGVVMQGIRIRLGRSIVTLMGVILGIAFLMSILTGQAIRKGVSREADARTEVKRMMSFLTAEIGPVEDRILGVVAVGPLNDTERRLLAEFSRRKVARLQWFGPLPADSAEAVVEAEDAAGVGQGAAAVCVAGAGTAAGVAWDRVLDGAEQRVLAVTRNAQAVPASPDMTVVGLEREWQPDELRDRALQEQRTRFRTGWVIAISLVVTVIGISNAMLMSVTERFREIGTMKCLGALSQFIRQVFFLEACVVGLAGSTAGCVFGAAFAAGAYSLSYGVELVAASMAPSVLLLHGGVCVAAGLVLSAVAAIYPAGVASRMLPAVALRSTV